MKRRQRPPTKPKAPDAAERSGLYPYLVEFLDHSAAQGLSPRTVALRDTHLRHFLRWCLERALDQPQAITRPILERYRRHLYHYRKADGEPLSFATQQQRLIPIKGFFAWLTRQNYILYNPASELELPRTHRRLPKHILSVEEIERIRKQTAVHGLLGIRDRAIIETFYSTGIRRSELIALKLYDVDLKNGSVLIRQGKGGKDRMVPLGRYAAHWIERYREEVRPELVIEPDRGGLFLHQWGERFSQHQLGDLIKRYLLDAGIDAVGSCHLFRHAMATHMLDNGADSRHLQAILGHRQLSTTEIYTQVSLRQLQDIHARTHPAERDGD